MPTFEIDQDKINFSFLDKYDAIQLAGIYKNLSHYPSIDANFFIEDRFLTQKLKNGIIQQFKRRKLTLELNLLSPKERVMAIVPNILSSHELGFIKHCSDELAIYLLSSIANYHNNIAPEKQKINGLCNIKEVKNHLYESIISSTLDKDKKIKILDNLKEDYYHSVNSFKFNWLDRNNKSQSLWSKEYFLNNDLIKNEIKVIPNLFFEENHTISIPSIFHALHTNDAEKKLFLYNFKKAWSQKKYRDNAIKDKKKTLNIVVDESVSKQLKYLSKEFDMPINKIISLMTSQFTEKTEELKAKINENKKKKQDEFSRII